MTTPKHYDADYYRRWYHDPAQRVITPEAVARKVRLVLGIAESLLERPVRSVLDVGCGEGGWRTHLRRMRPGLRYTGVESSEYVLERFGRARDIRRGSFGTLGEVRLAVSYDLVVVCDVLQYVPDREPIPGFPRSPIGSVGWSTSRPTRPRMRSRGTTPIGTIGARSSTGGTSGEPDFRRSGCTVMWLARWRGGQRRSSADTRRRDPP